MSDDSAAALERSVAADEALGLADPVRPASRETVVLARDLVVALNGCTVVDRACLTVERGHFAAVVGPSGAGKTTLLRALLGLVPIRSGKALLFGTPSSELGER